jgi:hypothetical protein
MQAADIWPAIQTAEYGGHEAIERRQRSAHALMREYMLETGPCRSDHGLAGVPDANRPEKYEIGTRERGQFDFVLDSVHVFPPATEARTPRSATIVANWLALAHPCR